MEEKILPLEDLINTIAARDDKDRSSSLVTTVLMIGVAIAFGVMGLMLALSRRKVVLLESELRKQAEAKVKAEEETTLAYNDGLREAAQEEIKSIESQVKEIKKEIISREADYIGYATDLDRVVSWDQIVIVDSRKVP